MHKIIHLFMDGLTRNGCLTNKPTITLKKVIILLFAWGMMTGLITPLFANPEGGQVVSGDVTLSHPDADTLHVQQSSDKAIIDWRSYNIAPNETTRYQQPSSNSIVLNRVDPAQGVSQILGTLSANGQVWIVNPAGIFFGSGAIVDTGGLLATTANISNEDFLSENYSFSQSAYWDSSVTNEGLITIAEGGFAALVSPQVVNRGIIQAHLGEVVLASATEFTIDFYGDQLINFGLPSQNNLPDNQPAVQQSGSVIANGGKILVTANTVDTILGNMINMDGYLEATSVEEKNGEIVLNAGKGGEVFVSGKINASGKNQNQKGGNVKVLGDKVTMVGEAAIDVSGDQGGGEVLIGGDYQGKNPHVLNAEQTYLGDQVVINADAITAGQGGRVIVWSDGITDVYGDISARGGADGSHGGFIETSGKILNVHGSIDAGNLGIWLLDPANVTIAAATANGSFDGGDPNTFTTTANNATVDVATINTSLNSGTNVTILTTPGGTQAGNITVSSAILKSSGATTPTLRLEAVNNITVSNTISASSGGLNVNLIADADSSGAGATTIGSAITTNGGTFQNSSAGALTINAAIDTGGGSFTNTTSDTLVINAGITTGGGAFTSSTQDASSFTANTGSLNTGAGAITFNVNQDGIGGQNFTMNANTSITNTNTSANAVVIKVNTASGGTGTAVLRDISTGTGGTLTVTTDTGGSTTGGNITTPSGTINVGSAVFSSPAAITLTGTITGTGTFLFSANTDGSGSQDFTMNTGSSITTTSNSSDAVKINVNTAAGGTGLANLADITTGSSGTLTVATDVGGNTTGSNITTDASTTLSVGNLSMKTPATITLVGSISGSGTLSFAANNDGSGGQDFTMSSGSAITTTNASSSAVSITVNSSVGGTGSAALRDITTGSGGTVTVSTDTGSNTTGGDITQPSGAINVGTGTVTLSTPVVTGHNIGTNALPIQMTASQLNATTGSAGIFVVNSGTSALSLGTINTSGGFTLTSTSSSGITDSGTLTVTGTTTLTAGNSQDITFDNVSNDFGTLVINSGKTVSVVDSNALTLGDITIQGSLTTTSGDLSVANGGIVNTANHAIDITATDINLNTTGALNAGSGDISITLSTANGSIALGNGSGSMTISGSELQRMTANTLTLIAPANGSIGVNGITSANRQNIAGSMTLKASTNNSANIYFEGSASDFGTLFLNAGPSGTIAFNTTTGTNQFNTLTVNSMQLMTINDLNVSGVLRVGGERVNGSIDVNRLSLNVNFANLFGLVNGLSGRDSFPYITLLNTIGPHTHFFNGIDLFSSYGNIQPQFIFSYLGDGFFGWNYSLLSDDLFDESIFSLMPVYDPLSGCLKVGEMIWMCLDT